MQLKILSLSQELTGKQQQNKTKQQMEPSVSVSRKQE